MAKWRPKNIYIYFNDIFGSMGENCLPYMPESFTCNINGRNEEIDILHGVGSDDGLAGTMNFVKRPGLKTWSIECFFSHPDRPLYATVSRSHHWTPAVWVEFFESAMYQQKILEMTVSGLDIVTYVTIENFKHTKEAGEEIDTYYTIDIKEYQFQEIKHENINIVQEIPSYENTGGQNTNQQGTKTNINANAWLIGPAYRSYTSDNRLINPFPWVFTNGTKKVEGYANFNFLPVKIIDKKNISKGSLSITGLGQHIIDYWKQANPNILLAGTVAYLSFAIRDAWDNHDNLHEFFNGVVATPSIISNESSALNNLLLKFLQKKFGSTYNIGTITLPKFSELLKEFFNASIYTGLKFTYQRGGATKKEICQCESLVNFLLNDGTGIGYQFSAGTKLWTYGDRTGNGFSFVTNNNNGNIPFTVSGINKDNTQFSTSQYL